MNQEFISQRKKDLEGRKRELGEQLKKFAGQGKNSKNDWQTEFPQMNESDEDKGDEVEEYTNLLPVEYTLEDDLKDVNEALARIEKGSYGKCEKCHSDISEERLIIFPEAKTCNKCDTKKRGK
jgi:RNA polymerase-binding transcription factor DksA